MRCRLSHTLKPLFLCAGMNYEIISVPYLPTRSFIFSHAVGREKYFDVAIPNAVHCVGSMEAA